MPQPVVGFAAAATTAAHPTTTTATATADPTAQRVAVALVANDRQAWHAPRAGEHRRGWSRAATADGR